MKRFSFLALSFVLLGTCTGLVQASPIIVGEVGDVFGSATNVDGDFDLSSDVEIFNSTTIPHVSILSTNDAFADVDWYSFTGAVGATLDMDIDHAMFSFDPILSLFDAGGFVLAVNDDGYMGDPGSVHDYDSYIGLILPYSGTYYAAVSNYANFPPYTGGGGYESGSYVLHISTDHAVTATPEPVSMVLLGLTTLGGIGLRLRRNRKAQDAQAAV